MQSRLVWCVLGGIMVWQGANSHAADKPAIGLKQGERIVFLGDSITQAGVAPKGYVTLINQTLQVKHQDLGIEVIGAGISGNKVRDLQARLQKDVLARKPTLVVIYIGINDIWHGENGTKPEPFADGLKQLIKQCTTAGARVVLCTPTVIGEKKAGSNSMDEKLDQYAEIGRKLAREHNIPLSDLRKAFVDHLKANNPDDHESGILTSDTVHLNEAGNELVARTILATIDPGQ